MTSIPRSMYTYPSSTPFTPFRLTHSTSDIQSRRLKVASVRSMLDREEIDRQISISDLHLLPEYQSIYTANPHSRQVFLNGDELVKRENPVGEKEREMNYASESKVYERRKGQAKTVIHAGQRKLFFGELEFLSKWSRKGDVVVYVGAAPGTHIGMLANMFEDRCFVLIDPTV